MKTQIITFLFILAFGFTFSQTYEKVQMNEPFRRADMIVIDADTATLDPNAFNIIGKILVSHNFTIKDAYKEFGSIVTNYNNGRFLQWQCEIVIVKNEVRIQGRYNSSVALGNQMMVSALAGKEAAQTSGVLLDYRDDLKDYYNEMTAIAQEIKSNVNGLKLFHVERAIIKK
jgi:hypothetical protein